jgi:dTMP kinase
MICVGVSPVGETPQQKLQKKVKPMFIVLDGLDGCGKTTQTELLIEYLEARNESVLPLSFPFYESKSSTAVKMYLGGEIADDANEINAYAASSFYAVDRYISFKQSWGKDFNKYKYIVSARYVSSNIIHQLPKLPENERESFAHWLYDYEFNRLGLPKPDLTIFLDQKPENAAELLQKRYGGLTVGDIHENNANYIKNCRDTVLKLLPDLGWVKIECFDEQRIKSRERITAEIIATVNEFKQC